MKLWAAKRKLAGLSVIGFFILLIVGILLYNFYPRASCTDNTQNGDEEGVDCGGSCRVQCVVSAHDPLVVWSRFFRVRDGVYDVGALVENINLNVGAKEFHYTFRMYDSANILLDQRSGVTYLNPEEQAFIYEPHLVSGNRYPARVDFQYDAFSWEHMDKQPPYKIDVTEKTFDTSSGTRLYVTLANRGFTDEKNLEVFSLLKNTDGNVYAVSRTTTDLLVEQSVQRISFTWPAESLLVSPATIEVLYRRIPR